MTMDEAQRIAKANPGQGIRDNANMQPKWKVVWINIKRIKGGGDFFCINPITGSDYQFRASEANRASTKWSLV